MFFTGTIKINGFLINLPIISTPELQTQWALPEWELRSRLEKARMKIFNTGAHDVIDSIADAPFTIEKINTRLANRKISGLSTVNPYWISLNHTLRQKTA